MLRKVAHPVPVPGPRGSSRPTDPPGASLSRSVVDEAQARLDGMAGGDRAIRRTPVIRTAELDALAGARIWLKAENAQIGGSFKVRGALLAVDALAREGCSGVIAHSTGNHGIAVALAAGEFGLPAEVVLPRDASPTKIALIQAAGARIVFSGSTVAERRATLRRRASATGFSAVDPYDNLDVIAGQATASAELLDQVRSAGHALDALVVPVGGGSVLAGACLAVSGASTVVIAAESAAVDSLTQALLAGRPVSVAGRATIADGLRPDSVGQLPFDLCRFAVSAVHTVEEEAIVAAVRVAFGQAQQLIEPAAAVALAVALRLAGEDRWRGRDIGVLLTGGNVDPRWVESLTRTTPAAAVDHEVGNRVAGDR